MLETAPSPSESFDTKPNRNDPTSGSISHSVRRSFPVRPDLPSVSVSNLCTETPPYMKFLNCVSKVSHSRRSSTEMREKKENGSFRDEEEDD
jgi:hypothetical protein